MITFNYNEFITTLYGMFPGLPCAIEVFFTLSFIFGVIGVLAIDGMTRILDNSAFKEIPQKVKLSVRGMFIVGTVYILTLPCGT